MDILIATLAAWISAQTGLAMIEPPKITFVTTPVMSTVALGPNAAASSHLRALYSQQQRTIYLRLNWHAASLRDQSELVHELVHHFQNINNQSYNCAAEREELAYGLQIAWLRDQGVKDPYDLLEINGFFVVMASVCRDADHD